MTIVSQVGNDMVKQIVQLIDVLQHIQRKYAVILLAQLGNFFVAVSDVSLDLHRFVHFQSSGRIKVTAPDYRARLIQMLHQYTRAAANRGRTSNG